MSPPDIRSLIYLSVLDPGTALVILNLRLRLRFKVQEMCFISVPVEQIKLNQLTKPNKNCVGQKYIGQRYAILEIKAALCGVLRKFKLKPVDTPLSCRFKLELVLRTIHELKVKFVPRQ
ncbi:hypothetical protein NQ318_003695 [Aromia moschata]|uniref:Uncharacterized protein n=1 Tax=Aromia moschata TaxID=1265417 RepID=A0AAV8YG71_9CUCU|nr:hypothetical protein NQ318_003695 [Aromia moschata]